MTYDWVFQQAVEFVLKKEGGYVNHPDDPGGETNFGISKRAYPHLDIAALTRKEAIQIYHEDYWLPISREVEHPHMQFIVFDAAVNHGVTRAVNWSKTFPTPISFMANRFKFWASLKTFKTFGAGWVNRGASVLEELDREHGMPMFLEVMIDHRPLWQRLASAVSGKSYDVTFRVRPMTSGPGMKMDVK